MLLEPQCTGPITRSRQSLCLSIVFLSISEYYSVLQYITEYYRVLQSISSASTWTNFWACLFQFSVCHTKPHDYCIVYCQIHKTKVSSPQNIFYPSTYCSPSVSQSVAVQMFEIAGSQIPLPVLTSGTQERLFHGGAEHFPQQQCWPSL